MEDKIYKCDYVQPHSSIECGAVMDFYPNQKAPGEYVYCPNDGNKKHIIKVSADWDEITGKPDQLDNAVYSILGMILDSSKFSPFKDANTIGQVKKYLNDVVLKNLTTNFKVDKTKMCEIIYRYLESIKYRDSESEKENSSTLSSLAKKRNLPFSNESSTDSVFGVDADETAHDLYKRG